MESIAWSHASRVFLARVRANGEQTPHDDPISSTTVFLETLRKPFDNEYRDDRYPDVGWPK